MSEKAKNSATQNTIQDPPEYNAKNPKQPQKGSDWLGGPQNGDKTSSDTYQQNGQSWLGGPQNGNETPGKSPEGAYQQNGQSWLGGPQNGDKAHTGSDYTKHRFSDTSSGSDFIGGPQDVNEIPGSGGNGGNGGGSGGNGGNGAGNGGNGGNGGNSSGTGTGGNG